MGTSRASAIFFREVIARDDMPLSTCDKKLIDNPVLSLNSFRVKFCSARNCRIFSQISFNYHPPLLNNLAGRSTRRHSCVESRSQPAGELKNIFSCPGQGKLRPIFLYGNGLRRWMFKLYFNFFYYTKNIVVLNSKKSNPS